MDPIGGGARGYVTAARVGAVLLVCVTAIAGCAAVAGIHDVPEAPEEDAASADVGTDSTAPPDGASSSGFIESGAKDAQGESSGSSSGGGSGSGGDSGWPDSADSGSANGDSALPIDAPVDTGDASTGLVAVAITPQDPSTYLGHNEQFTATGTFTNGMMANVTNAVMWSSSSPSVAMMSSNTPGLAFTSSSGTTTITATDPSTGLSATATLTVLANGIKSISVTPISATVTTTTQDKNAQFTAIATYDDGTTGDVTSAAMWVSSATQIASIAAGGLATANSTVWTTSSSYTQPDVCTSCSATCVSTDGVTVSFLSSTQMAVGEQLLISGIGYRGGNYQICSVGVNSATLINLGGVSNASPGTNIPTGTSANLVGSTIITATAGGVTSNNATLLVTAAVLSSISVGVASNVTTTAAVFTQPASSAVCTLNAVTVSIPSPSGAFFAGLPAGNNGAPLQIGGNAYILCSVNTSVSPNTLTVINPGLNGSAAPGASIPVTSVVSTLSPDCAASGTTFTCNNVTYSPAVSCPLGRVQRVYAIAAFSDGTCADVSTNGAYAWATSDPSVGTVSSSAVATACAPAGYPAGVNDTVAPEAVGPPGTGATTGSATLTVTEQPSGLSGTAIDTVTAAVVDATGAGTCTPPVLAASSLTPSAGSIEYVTSFTSTQVTYGTASFTAPAFLAHSVYSDGGQTYSNCSTIAGASTTGTGGAATWGSSSAAATIASSGTTAVAGNWTSATSTTASFVQPAAGSAVNVSVGSTAGMTAGQPVFVNTGGQYSVSSVTDATTVVLANTGAGGNAASGTTIASGAAAFLPSATAAVFGTTTIAYSYTDTNAGSASCGNTPATATAALTVKKPYAKGVTAGLYSACAWTSDGGYLCWGDNGNYQIGQPPGAGVPCKAGGVRCMTTPTAVPGLGVALAGGWQNPRAVFADDDIGYANCIVLADGTVRCMGYDTDGDLGDGATTQTDQPVPVVTAAGTTTTGSFTQPSSGANVTVSVSSTTGMTVDQYVYIDSGTQDTPFVGSSGSYYVVAAVNSATSVTLTNDTDGLGTHNLSSGTSFPSGSVVAPQSLWLTGATSVGGQKDGECAVATNGGANPEIYCWGANTYGQLGYATTTTCGTTACSRLAQPVETSTSTVLTGAVKAIAYDYSFCGIAGTSVYCWGACGTDRMCGSGNTANGAAATDNVIAVGGITGTPVDIAVGFADACVRTTAPAVQCWGGEFGGSTGNTTSPDTDLAYTQTPTTVTSNGTVPLAGMSGSAAFGLLSMGGVGLYASAGGKQYYGSSALVVLASGGVDGWGTNGPTGTGTSGGILGNGNTTDQGYAVPTLGLSTGTALTGVVYLDTGYATTCAVVNATATNGETQSLYCWGDNATTYTMGDGTATSQTEAEQIPY